MDLHVVAGKPPDPSTIRRASSLSSALMKRKPRLTKRERKALAPARPNPSGNQHIHCVACGAHISPADFTAQPAAAAALRCRHGTNYAACIGCVPLAKKLLDDH